MNTKSFKIAVCLSGQARSWKTAARSCRSYFNLPGYDVKFFGHTWDLNTWRKNSRSPYENEYLDIDMLRSEMIETYQFSSLHIDRFDELSPMLLKAEYDTPPEGKDLGNMAPMEHSGYMTRPVGWTPMMYSAMVANHLKQTYEIENGVEFDVVVRSRFDLCHKPASSFLEQLNKIPNYGTSKILLCNGRSFDYEWGLAAIDDTFYYGSSDVMDIVDSFSNSYLDGSFWRMINCNSDDSAFKVTGPNVLLYKWCEIKNIMLYDVGPFGFPVVRRNVDDGNWSENYEKIKDAWANFHV
jgi:hypothetical protein